MEELDKLRKDLEVGTALDEMRNHHGFKHFSRLVQDVYGDSVLRALNGDEKSRLYCVAISELNELFNLRIALAKNAAEELKQDKFKEPWGAA